MKTLVVAFDNSGPSTRAAKEAAALARRLDAKLKIAYVVAPTTPIVGDFSGAATLQLLAELRKAGAHMVEEEAKRISALGLPVETVVIEGRPADELAALAAQPDVEMLVVGRSGHGAIAHALLGSVVNRLLATCTRPVLVVP